MPMIKEILKIMKKNYIESTAWILVSFWFIFLVFGVYVSLNLPSSISFWELWDFLWWTTGSFRLLASIFFFVESLSKQKDAISLQSDDLKLTRDELIAHRGEFEKQNDNLIKNRSIELISRNLNIFQKYVNKINLFEPRVLPKESWLLLLKRIDINIWKDWLVLNQPYFYGQDYENLVKDIDVVLLSWDYIVFIEFAIENQIFLNQIRWKLDKDTILWVKSTFFFEYMYSLMNKIANGFFIDQQTTADNEFKKEQIKRHKKLLKLMDEFAE